jgi:hypothetical protein
MGGSIPPASTKEQKDRGSTMQVFAIRHKPTGAWMPTRMFRRGGGWSHWMPGPPVDGYEGLDGFDKNPRIFFTLQAARNALTMWLRGTWREERRCSETLEGREDWTELVPDAPPVERKREDMEIVSFLLIEGREEWWAL